MKFENTQVWGFEHAIRGMRNPKESWDRSDSFDCFESEDDDGMPRLCQFCDFPGDDGIDCSGVDKAGNSFALGPNDIKLMQTLIKAGSEHRKFMRQIFISVDITAPLFWFKEFDTYRIGVTENSTSTMHKLTSKPITIDCFEIDDYNSLTTNEIETGVNLSGEEIIIQFCESLRQKYLATKDKKYWKELVRWLPEGWLQTRTVTMTYENLYSIVHQRLHHKLNEWSGCDDPSKMNFIKWVQEEIPYSNILIFEPQDITFQSIS